MGFGKLLWSYLYDRDYTRFHCCGKFNISYLFIVTIIFQTKTEDTRDSDNCGYWTQRWFYILILCTNGTASQVILILSSFEWKSFGFSSVKFTFTSDGSATEYGFDFDFKCQPATGNIFSYNKGYRFVYTFEA